MGVLRSYLKIPLVTRVFAALLLGGVSGTLLWLLSTKFAMESEVLTFNRYCAPFGNAFIGMLKMIVIPIIFFSLVSGASSLATGQLGKVGGKVILWYFVSMAFAATLGVTTALIVNPGAGGSLAGWRKLVDQFGGYSPGAVQPPDSLADILQKLLTDIFQNPFAAFANSNFLGVIAFAILFGISLRLVLESDDAADHRKRVRGVMAFFDVCMAAINRIIDFVMNYSPIGVFFLTMGIFSVYGSAIVGPYIGVVTGVVCGVSLLLFVVYPIMLLVVTRQNPYQLIGRIRGVMMLAFVTRSSAATLPMTIRVSEEQLGINRELCSFALPLGATVNMNGTCIHLPMFAILAANMFDIKLGIGSLTLVTLTTVLSAVGACGMPGSSVMLLFVILSAIGLDSAQTTVIVALAMGINPIVDMFGTVGNVSGDIFCTYAVAHREGLVERV